MATRSPKAAAAATPATTATKPAKGVRVRPVPAVTRSIAILRLLGEQKQPLALKTVAQALDLVPSTCLHILRVLVAEDLVTVDPTTKRYALGTGMISLARSVLEGGGFTQLVQPVLDRMAGQFGVTAMGVEITARQTVLVLAISQSNQPFRVHTDVGSQFDTLVSATGRLIAAYSGESWPVLKAQFAQVVWDQAPTFTAWKKEVELTRERGWALDRDNFMAGITVVAVPVLSSGGRLVNTLVAVGLTSQLGAARVQQMAQVMQREAAELSALLVGPGA
ncbi:DNA-binding IclR family transcriptional regulator [Acidovorax soli]|uniref:DNA-binding IclR family transcriptional regulator n=1 Tax=Acidovorax soli TaxID=592050 RepID=A0A7X0UD97_9BURK|nr:IclR family transcriptional regulator [Acidovorax soli]MBB6564256.1 DNA-binding IclR family transcriptional regulator [Acidovorax soli]